MFFNYSFFLLEYGDIIWDNCPNYLKDHFNKIQSKATSIITGCTSLVSLDNLYNEWGWKTLTWRRNKHKHILLYTMFHGLSPDYLFSLVPSLVENQSQYPFRNGQDIQSIVCSQTHFLPSDIREWNNRTLHLYNGNFWLI